MFTNISEQKLTKNYLVFYFLVRHSPSYSWQSYSLTIRRGLRRLQPQHVSKIVENCMTLLMDDPLRISQKTGTHYYFIWCRSGVDNSMARGPH